MNLNICNNCGGDYEYRNGRWRCRSCGSYKPEELSNEEVTLLYMASQKLRMAEFDEAEKGFDDIIRKYPQNSCGYWGRLMARYGIKYEDDFDGKRIPTCYATSIESVTADSDYRNALKYADNDTKAYYAEQSEYIERVRKEWIEKAKKEKPYDIFLCYKDSDLANGIERTEDSIAAQELYIHLTEQGYRVFFSRESLRDKAGEKYEPYIFNALSTAKIMLVYGSSAEYINSTWLRNEWTRYEKRIQSGEKAPDSLLIACDGFSPDELPKALASRQCLLANQRQFYGDLDRAIARIIQNKGKGQKAGDNRSQKKKKKKTPIGCAIILVVLFGLWLLGEGMDSPGELQFTDNGDGTWYVSGVGTCKDEDVVIPATYKGGSVTGIGNHAFENYYNLSSIDIPNTVTYIGSYAFSGCFNLTSVTIPEGVMSIENSTFEWCSGLTSIDIPDSITRIGDAAFSYCTVLTSVIIPDGVTDIGNRAFDNCLALNTIIMPDTVTNMGDYAFQNCASLTSIVIPDGMTSMGFSIFDHSGLTSIVIPAGMTEISDNAFTGCENLAEITVKEGNPVYHSAGNCVIDTQDKMIIFGCKNSVIPTDGSVTAIGHGAFGGCTGLTSIFIPSSVTSIDGWAFNGCSGLTEIIVAEDNPTYHSAGNCVIETQNKKLLFGCKSSMIPTDGSVTSIGHSAFYRVSGLTSIVIPGSVTDIDMYAFEHCSDLASVVLSPGTIHIGDSAFANCEKLSSIIYNGTIAEWNAITKDEKWNYHIPATTVRCTDGMTTVS